MTVLARAAPVVLSTVVLLVGCDGPTVADRYPPTKAVVYGVVTDVGGDSISDVQVSASSYRLGCPDNGGEGPFPVGDAVSGTDGSFEIVASVRGLAPAEQCVVVSFMPSDTTRLAGTSDTVPAVDFRLEAPFDSVQLEIALDSAGL